MVGGFNVIVFAIIGVLAHREKKQKKREGQVGPATPPSDSPTPSIGHEDKKVASGVQAVEI